MVSPTGQLSYLKLRSDCFSIFINRGWNLQRSGCFNFFNLVIFKFKQDVRDIFCCKILVYTSLSVRTNVTFVTTIQSDLIWT